MRIGHGFERQYIGVERSSESRSDLGNAKFFQEILQR